MELSSIKATLDIKFIVFALVCVIATITSIVFVSEHIANKRESALTEKYTAQLKLMSDINKQNGNAFTRLAKDASEVFRQNQELLIKLNQTQDKTQTSERINSLEAINYAIIKNNELNKIINETQTNITIDSRYRCVTIAGVKNCYRKSHSGGSGSGSAIVS